MPYKGTEKKRAADREGLRKWRAANPNKNREYKRKDYAANPEKAHESVRKWCKANPDKKREGDRKWNDANLGRNNESKRKWNVANPGKRRASASKRRASELGAGGAFTAQEFTALKVHFGSHCLCCGKTESELTLLGCMLVPDHVVPLAPPYSGSNAISNIQSLCHGKGGCNNIKGAKYIDWRHLRSLGIVVHNLAALKLVGLTRF